MKVFSATQIKACDAHTIKSEHITSADLMERAANRCVEWITANLPANTLFITLCGSGNNGGDGMAVTRILHQKGYGVKAFLLQSGNLSADCATNLERLKNIDNGIITTLQNDTFITDIPRHIVIIDALLGTGLNRPVTGWLAAFINRIDQLPNRKLAIDVPSGLYADSVNGKDACIIKAGDTLSFQFYKRSFLHAEAAPFTGEIHILDIGLDKKFIKDTHTQYNTVGKREISHIYKPRSPFAHKGTYGSALLIGGSYGKMGAVTMSSLAALRAGAGLVSALIPGCGYGIIQTAVPEVMCRTNGEKHIEKIDEWDKMKAIGIGPGIGTEKATAKAFTAFIDACKHPVVIDADALNLLAKQQELLAKIPSGSILTPHPKEFERLFGKTSDSMAQLELARIQAMRYNIHIVLKGHHTAVVMPNGECWYNMTGNAGMATGGAGDVLTGIITGLLAQQYEPREAAILGVYLHGLAGDIAATKLSQEALVAGDIINCLGKAFLKIANEKH